MWHMFILIGIPLFVLYFIHKKILNLFSKVFRKHNIKVVIDEEIVKSKDLKEKNILIKKEIDKNLREGKEFNSDEFILNMKKKFSDDEIASFFVEYNTLLSGVQISESELIFEKKQMIKKINKKPSGFKVEDIVKIFKYL